MDPGDNCHVMDAPIDLGTTSDLPTLPIPEKVEKSYPGTYLTLPAGSTIPPSGTITFSYRTTGMSVRRRDGSKVCVDLELTALVKAESGVEHSAPTADQALDAFAKSLTKDEDGD